jgi:hypothetical protein
LADKCVLFGCEDVALVSSTDVCSAKTSYRFHYQVPGGGEFEGTVVQTSEKCQAGYVAVIGVDARAVRVIPQEADQSPAWEDVERKARALLNLWIRTSDKADEFGDISQNRLSKSPPKVLKAGPVTMLKFELNGDIPEQRRQGPVVLWLKNQLFRLEGWCTADHIFLAVNDKPYIAYTMQCCGCGVRILYVYDLSGDLPEKVYENDKLSD